MSLVPISPDLTAGVFNTLVFRATAVVGVAWLVSLALRRSAASTRHAVWNAALASLLALPLVSFALPRWDLAPEPQPATVSAMTRAEQFAATTSAASAPMPAEHLHGSGSIAPEIGTPRGPAAVIAAVLGLWALGAAFGLGRLSAGWAAARRLVRRARPIGSPHAEAALGELSSLLGVHREVRVLMSDTLTMPVSCGLLHPVILLPAAASSWSPERLRVVLLHELAHVRRWDYASLLAMEAARALYWMNPLVWTATRRANVELERACDDEVLGAGTRSLAYAEHLYEIAAALSGARTPSGALAMAQPSTLGTRVRAILAASVDRSRLRPRVLAGAAGVAMVVGLPLASMRLLGEGQEVAVERRALAALASPVAASRAQAAWVLGNARSRRTMPDLVMRLTDADASVRGMAAWALGNLRDGASFTPLTATLRDPDSDVREMAVLALGVLGDGRAVDSLARLAVDPEMGVRGVLTDALHHLGGARAADVLSDMMVHDPDGHVRSMATWAYQITAGPQAVPRLIDALRSNDPDLRQAAAANLGQLEDRRAIEALGQAALHDPVESVRRGAVNALGMMRDARAAAPLAGVFADSVWGIRVAATYALGRIPGQQATNALIAATRDPVHQVRLTAVEALNSRPR